MWFTSENCKMLPAPYDAQILAPVCCTYHAIDVFGFDMLQAFSSLCFFSASQRCKIKTRFADASSKMLQTSCNLQRLALHRSKILCNGKVPCNVRMLHHTMQPTGVSCKMFQIRTNFAQVLRGVEILAPEQCTISPTDAFTQRDA